MFGISCPRFGTNNSNFLLAILRFASARHFTSENLIHKKQSFTVSYLINSCGLAPKVAQSISKWFQLTTPDNPDSVILFFKDQGFTASQISKIVRIRPRVLRAKPNSSILPKLEFLRSVGASSSDLSAIVSRNPDILVRHLVRHLIPFYDILKRVLVTDEKVIRTLKRSSMYFPSMKDIFNVNLSLLTQIGMPQSGIAELVLKFPLAMCLNDVKFADKVKKIIEKGFDPTKRSFVMALGVFLQFSDTTWERKIEFYKMCGWSEDEILSILRKNPLSLAMSQKSVTSKMDFLVGKMGWKPADVAKLPVVLCCSLENRIMPRCLIARILLLKGLIKTNVPLSSLIVSSDERFMKTFVLKYKEEVPQLLDFFQGKVSFEELGFGFDENSSSSIRIV
ncbi:uncharacterized protein LOC126665564 [Mercurialis annua]|uniref:uncharacterized protein LOC126665564 n=1 Tax=Mercurialis annua TaxID=3986 RepID=UPI00215F649B|nr:uncharacterized protein LOC126665564 [Mercurialis annua]